VLSILVMGLVEFRGIHRVRFGVGLGWVGFYILYCVIGCRLLKVVASIRLLLGHPVMAHLDISSSNPAH
jgi:hypothetical protein